MIEKYERPDHPPFGEGQNPPHLEPAEVLPALVDHEFDHWGLSEF
jgi:hypothetical protein